MIKQEGAHPLVYSHRHFHAQNAQTCGPERVEKESVARRNTPRRQANGCSNSFEGKQASILSGAEQGRAPGENGLVCRIGGVSVG